MNISYNAQKNSQTEIIIESGARLRLWDSLETLGKVQRVALVTDSNVAPLYLQQVSRALAGAEVWAHTLQAGEQSKNMQTVLELYSFFDRAGITRNDLVVALGGGVVGDVVGFAAATFLRGVRVVQVPTTLLAMTDSAIGGKTGVDLPSGKNRAGAFHQPSKVIIDPEFLRTLPAREFACGMAEVIKYGCIKDAALLQTLHHQSEPIDIITTCVTIKAGVVQRDQFDGGERKLLNFGHTIGHAIEKHYNFGTYSHGEAVAAGMCMLNKANMALGGITQAECDSIELLCKKYALPTRIAIDKKSLIENIFADKKMEGSTLKLVVLKKLGEAMVVDCTPQALGEYL